MDDGAEYDEGSFDATMDLINEEEEDEEGNSSNGDVAEVVDIESDADDDIGAQLSSIKLFDKNSSSIDHFELLKSVFELMKKSRLIIKFVLNHTITNEYIQKSMMSKGGGNKVGGLVLDIIVRWNSSFLLLDRLIMHKDVINSIFAFPNNLVGLTDKQKSRLRELILSQHE